MTSTLPWLKLNNVRIKGIILNTTHVLGSGSTTDLLSGEEGRLPLSSGTPKAVHSHCFSAGPGKTGAKQSGRQGSEKFQTGREAKLSAYAKKILKALKKNFEE